MNSCRRRIWPASRLVPRPSRAASASMFRLGLAADPNHAVTSSTRPSSSVNGGLIRVRPDSLLLTTTPGSDLANQARRQGSGDLRSRTGATAELAMLNQRQVEICRDPGESGPGDRRVRRYWRRSRRLPASRCLDSSDPVAGQRPFQAAGKMGGGKLTCLRGRGHRFPRWSRPRTTLARRFILIASGSFIPFHQAGILPSKPSQ